VTESAEDRSKRVFLKHLSSSSWSRQISIFYPDEQSSKQHAIEDSKRLRKMLCREYKQQPWLYRLCLNYRKTGVRWVWGESIDEDTGEIEEISVKEYYEIEDPQHIAYHSLFTTEDFTRVKFEKFKALAEKSCDCSVSILRRSVSEDKLEKYGATVKRQKPHNFENYFGGDKKIHRFGLINKAALGGKSV
jgi:hypothetical protein